MKISQLLAEDAIASLRSSVHGLSPAEAARRLREYGLNRLEEIARESLFLRFLKELTRFFSMILWVAAALAFLAEWNEPGQGMARLGYAIIAVILISTLFSLWQEYRVERTIAALRELLPQRIEVWRDDTVIQLLVEQLVPGDIVLLEPGAHVPADCRLIEAFGVQVDNATVTGESVPQPRNAAPSEKEELIHASNVLLAGTSVVSGQAKAVVFATGMRTEFGKIARLTQASAEVVSPLRKEITQLSRLIVILAVLIGVIFFSFGLTMGLPFWEDFIFAIGLIVSMVPEGLLPTLTLALVLATQRMAKRKVLIRHLPSVETLGSTTVICTDKTGTLTQNRMTVRQLFLSETFVCPLTDGQQRTLGAHYQPFFRAARLCHDLRENNHQGQTTFLGDPMEIALVEMAQQVLPENEAPHLVDEIPFDASRMRLTTIYDMPEGPTLYSKGAPEALVPLCTGMLVDGTVRPFDHDERQKVFKAQEAMAAQGLRVLAFAYRTLPSQWDRTSPEQDLVFTGLTGLEDPPRPEVPEALRKCQEAGVKVIILTGDHPRTAEAIAREIGLVQSNSPVVVTGERLRGFSDAQLQLALDAPEIIFARVGADQKMSIVQALKQKGHVVAVTGDGVNDAPALKSAHIGIAMGIAGTDVAREAADMVLLDDNFASIVNAIEEGRAVFDNIRKFLTYILTHNVAELIPYLAFALGNIPLPLTPLQVLSIDMGTDSLTALGLGVEKPDPQVMARPPRPQTERLLNWGLALRAYVFLGMIEATGALTAFFFVLYQPALTFGQRLTPTNPLYLKATTACLSGIIVMQIVNVFLCRSPIRSVFSSGLGGNRLILWGVVFEVALILLIDYTAWGNILLGTAPIGSEVWLFLVPFAVGMAVLEEVRKWLVRRDMFPAEIRHGQ
ncbi:MAG: cation-transporting P-type ATPase [Deltaproteobacteria bacterium]|nr:cation-transporting P-type ATPase [Deltaproteobacteria bacterium]